MFNKLLLRCVLWLCEYISFDDLRNYYVERRKIHDHEKYLAEEKIKKEAKEYMDFFIAHGGRVTMRNLQQSKLPVYSLDDNHRVGKSMSLNKLRSFDKKGSE